MRPSAPSPVLADPAFARLKEQVIRSTGLAYYADKDVELAAHDLLQYLGFLAPFVGLDNPTSNDRTRELLGWEPTHPGWIEDVETGHYFA